MKNITNLKSSLLSLKKHLIREVNIIDESLREIENNSNKKYCPKCMSGDLRSMKNNQIFCRACGYDSRMGEKK